MYRSLYKVAETYARKYFENIFPYFYKNVQKINLKRSYSLPVSTTKHNVALQNNIKGIYPLINYLTRYQGCSSDATAFSCWHCDHISRKYEKFCSQCNIIQSQNKSYSYFDIFDLPPDFSLEPSLLTKKFRSLQAIYHPDKYSQRSKVRWIYSIFTFCPRIITKINNFHV